ncbi:hypothetical protein LEP1GSC188_1209 [Leptospira weilii serovar Topaz str. LT2116]|uniref:Uncharacterized protein n=1 Tax=Leptospira weilii serovar Topaz str. LT2116 TaxID=1088540 RepID=M3GCT2_9LEPT|nr:hypothetical protein LEP1GSC188_1209 [Leptospira weilii serovar Topaz str. LT2116]
MQFAESETFRYSAHSREMVLPSLKKSPILEYECSSLSI